MSQFGFYTVCNVLGYVDLETYFHDIQPNIPNKYIEMIFSLLEHLITLQNCFIVVKIIKLAKILHYFLQ